MEKWIDIARVGNWTDASGKEVKLSAEKLKNIAASYKPEEREAPLVFGHPTTNGPAYGWVEKLKVEGNHLWAKLKQVPDEVKEVIANGHYKHKSMSLYKDKEGWGLRHVGLLGATPPAIAGLKALGFAQGEEEYLTINFSEQEQEETMTEEIKNLKAEVKDLEAQLAAARAEAEQSQTEFSAYKEKEAGEKRKARVEKLVAEGKILPAEVPTILSLSASLAEGEDTIDFSTEQGAVEQVSKEEAYLRMLEGGKPHSLFNEFSAPLKVEEEEISAAELAAKM